MKNLSMLFLCIILFYGGQAYALSISPGVQIDDGVQSGVSTPDNSAITAYIQATYELDLLYKAEEGSSQEEGLLTGSYDTSFKNTPSDPSGAEITYILGEPFITDAYLLVKDGNLSPWWYLFDLTADGLNWDGMETIFLNDFWPDEGAISYVALYGNAAPVPEPSTIVLLGLGLVGLAGIGRKKIKS